jgi:glycolate oxidase iron-sulfur subunit
MQTALADFVRETPAGGEADSILRSCVHCGFCLPACPTYQLLGDELDSPRGRIYLMKQLLEGAPVTERTQLHLDRCLTCRACESACPSGVRYGRLLDIGRDLLEKRVPRTPRARLERYLLRRIMPYRPRVQALMSVARALGPLLPRALRARVQTHEPTAPAAGDRALSWPQPRHARRVVLLEGCVQPALAAGINPSAAQVLDRIGISAIRVPAAGCCGALSYHLSAHGEALRQMRHNVDALWPHVEAGAEALVITATACASMLTDYGRLLKDDPAYAARATRISALAADISQVLTVNATPLKQALTAAPHAAPASGAAPLRVAFQAPCSLQHALKLPGTVEPLLLAAGFTLTPVGDGQRCCGSAGTYSLLQPELSTQLLRAKVTALEAGQPDVIATANIGCLAHIRTGTALPVRHWVELLAARLGRG